MSNIVYLFGAGASAKCLPPVADMPARMEQMIKFLQDEKDKLSLNAEQESLFKTLLDDLKWLMQESKNHATIDTFARKVFITKGEYSDEYKRLKDVLSVYFALEQAKNKFDDRYDTLWTTILDEEGNLPANIRFISWNYDIQMDLAALQYIQHGWLYDVKKKFLPTLEKLVPGNNISACKVLKLNGTAGVVVHKLNLPYYCFETYSESLNTKLHHILAEYFALRSKKDTSNILSYSWEKSENIEYDNALRSYSDTDVLVVIGYSFPFFNRKIDRIILQSMINGNLKKIYVQDKSNAENIKQRIYSVIGEDSFNKKSNIHIIPISDCDNFYIPYEL